MIPTPPPSLPPSNITPHCAPTETEGSGCRYPNFHRSQAALAGSSPAAESDKPLAVAAFISPAAVAVAGKNRVSLTRAGAGHGRLPAAQLGTDISNTRSHSSSMNAPPGGSQGGSAPSRQPPDWVSVWGDATSPPQRLDVSQGQLPNPGEDEQPGSKWRCRVAGAGRKTEGVAACVAFHFLLLFFFFFPSLFS